MIKSNRLGTSDFSFLGGNIGEESLVVKKKVGLNLIWGNWISGVF